MYLEKQMNEMKDLLNRIERLNAEARLYHGEDASTMLYNIEKLQDQYNEIKRVVLVKYNMDKNKIKQKYNEKVESLKEKYEEERQTLFGPYNKKIEQINQRIERLENEKNIYKNDEDYCQSIQNNIEKLEGQIKNIQETEGNEISNILMQKENDMNSKIELYKKKIGERMDWVREDFAQVKINIPKFTLEDEKQKNETEKSKEKPIEEAENQKERIAEEKDKQGIESKKIKEKPIVEIEKQTNDNLKQEDAKTVKRGFFAVLKDKISIVLSKIKNIKLLPANKVKALSEAKEVDEYISKKTNSQYWESINENDYNKAINEAHEQRNLREKLEMLNAENNYKKMMNQKEKLTNREYLESINDAYEKELEKAYNEKKIKEKLENIKAEKDFYEMMHPDTQIIDEMQTKEENNQTHRNDEQENINNTSEKPTVIFNINTGTYTLIDEFGYKYERDIEPSLLNTKSRNAFAVEVLEKYFNKPDAEDVEISKDVSKKADINLYSLYESYDKENGTDYAREYMSSIYDIDRDTMPTNVIYDFSRKNKNENKNVKLTLRDKILIKKMAKEHSNEMKIADINEVKFSKKLAIGLGLAGGIAALGMGSAKLINENNQENNQRNEKNLEVVNWEDIQPEKQESKPSIKQTLKVDNLEKLSNENNEEEIKIGVGSKALLDEGTYYYSSELAAPTGKMENKDNKEVEINIIAVVGEDGLYKHCLMNGNIEDVIKENPNSKIMVHISNEDGDLGWISYDEVKDKFEQNVNKQKQVNDELER